METDEQTIRAHSIIARTLLQVEAGEEIRSLSRSMGIPNESFADFIMGIMYCSTQDAFRKESGLNEKEADRKFLGFWIKEGNDVRTRLIQIINEQSKK